MTKALRLVLGFFCALSLILAGTSAAMAQSDGAPATASTQAGTLGCVVEAGLTVGSTVVSSGAGRCTWVARSMNVGVTVATYVDGWYVDSSYRECPIAAGAGGQCNGDNVYSTRGAGQYCTKVWLDYQGGDGIWQQNSTTMGAGCP